MKTLYPYLLLCTLIYFCSCTGYRKSRMFVTSEEFIIDSLQKYADEAEENYRIQRNDYIKVEVFTSKGERIVDPNSDFATETQGEQRRESYTFLVRNNGYVKLPMIGDVYLEGYTLYEADSILEREYSNYYKDVFVLTAMANKRVLVMGPAGGKVIPLENENINLIEVITLYGGITDRGNAGNIKLIRGDLDNPHVDIIDLSTIEGLRQANLGVEPNDIVYIETIRPSALQTARQILPVFSVLTSVVTLILLIAA